MNSFQISSFKNKYKDEDLFLYFLEFFIIIFITFLFLMVAEEIINEETKVEETKEENVEPKTPTKRKYTKKTKPVEKVEDDLPKVSFQKTKDVEERSDLVANNGDDREILDKGKDKESERSTKDGLLVEEKIKEDERLKDMMQKEFRREFLVYKTEKMAIKKRLREETSNQFENDKMRRKEAKQDRIYGRMFG